MENTNNEVSTAEGQLPPASWQEYYQAAQQLFEAGDEEQAQAYYEVAQQLYEVSGDDIGATADGAEPGQEVAQLPPPSVNDAYTDLNSIIPSVAPPPAEVEISEEAHKQWAQEYASMAPEPYDEAQAAKRKKLIWSVIGVGIVLVVCAGAYFYWQSRPAEVKSVTTISQPGETTEQTDHYSSKPSADRSDWKQAQQAGTMGHRKARRGRGGGGGGARNAKPKDKSDDSGAFSKQKSIGKDPMGGLDL